MIIMPPMALSRVHYHARSEIIVLCTRGWAATAVGVDFETYIHGPGEFLYIPAGVVHCAINLSTTEELTAVEVRTDPSFLDDVVVLDELEENAHRLADRLRDEFIASGRGARELPV